MRWRKRTSKIKLRTGKPRKFIQSLHRYYSPSQYYLWPESPSDPPLPGARRDQSSFIATREPEKGCRPVSVDGLYRVVHDHCRYTSGCQQQTNLRRVKKVTARHIWTTLFWKLVWSVSITCHQALAMLVKEQYLRRRSTKFNAQHVGRGRMIKYKCCYNCLPPIATCYSDSKLP